jgi:Fe-S-cluster containining protein
VRITLELETALGPRALGLEIDSAPMRLSALVPLAQQVTDAMVAAAIERERNEGRQISCRPNCAACCRSLVAISAPEAFVIADHVAALPEEERAAAFARFEHAEATLATSGLSSRLSAFMRADTPGPERRQLAAEYFSLALACPLLVDEQCSAYTARPLSCRDLNVTSPAELCARPPRGAEQLRRVPTAPLWSLPLARVAAKLTQRPLEFVPLALALRYAEDHAEEAFLTWPGTEVVKHLMHEIGQRATT